MLGSGPNHVKHFTTMIPSRIISGGQTGVDRAALDVALALGIPCGGWCPKGRRAEDGPLAPRYPMKETSDPDPAERTRLNVAWGDATLILATDPLAGGTALTRRWAGLLKKPHLVVPAEPASHQAVSDWLAAHSPRVLNVAGPRESEVPGAYLAASAFLQALFGPER